MSPTSIRPPLRVSVRLVSLFLANSLCPVGVSFLGFPLAKMAPPKVLFMTNPSEDSQNPPAWIEEFTSLVGSGMSSLCTPSALGCHYFFDEENASWEITLFTGRTEVLGGAHDGLIVPTSTDIDVKHIAAIFSDLAELKWHSESQNNSSLGPFLSFVGEVGKQRVVLRILQDAPDWAGPGQLLESNSGDLIECWKS